MTEPKIIADLVWTFIHDNPGCSLAEISSALNGEFSGTVHTLKKNGEIISSGKKWSYRYTLADPQPSGAKMRKLTYQGDDKSSHVVTVSAEARRAMFEECRQHSGNYWLTQRLREVRA